jgi:GntR family transcriptional regulator
VTATGATGESAGLYDPGDLREPKYFKLKRSLLELLEPLAAGSAIPPERTLAMRFETSRTTVRQAVQELIIEGRLERFHGKGTFVAEPKVALPLQLTSHTEDMQAQGLAPTSRVLSISTVPAWPDLAEHLRVAPDDEVVRIERLRLASGDPMTLEVTHLPAAAYPDLAGHLENYTSLYTLLDEVYGVRLADAVETIESALAAPREAGLLEIDVGLPVLLLTRHSFDAAGRPVEWVRAYCRGDRYKFVAHLRRPPT